MSGLTSYESQLLLARAIVELAEGKEGPGVTHARNLVALADAGINRDPYALQSPKPAPKPLSAEALTNDRMDGRPDRKKPKPTPIPGVGGQTNSGLDRLLRRKAKNAPVCLSLGDERVKRGS